MQGYSKAFDRLTANSKRHFSAISNSSIIDPFEAVALSMLLEVAKRLEALEDGNNEKDVLLDRQPRGGRVAL